jgi:hypothetical protein
MKLTITLFITMVTIYVEISKEFLSKVFEECTYLSSLLVEYTKILDKIN